MWKGPLIDGVTQSLINTFLECPYSFYIYTILGLKDPSDVNENLIWGDCYHVGLEHYIPSGDFEYAHQKMIEHLHTKYPHHPDTYPFSLRKMLWEYSLRKIKGSVVTEEIIDDYIDINNYKVRVRGKKDGVITDHPDYGTVLVEHKAKGYIDPLKTREELHEDIQCNLYMKMQGNCEWVFYDLIKIPEAQKYSPKRGAREQPEKYMDRLFYSPDIGNYKDNYPISSYLHNWIHQGTHFIPQEQQERVFDLTIKPTILRMIQWYDYVTQPDFDFEDPKWFNEIFYKHPVRHFNARQTKNYNCRYHAYLTNQISLDQLEPVESYYSELEV